MVGVNLNYFSPSFHIEMFINYVQSYLRREFMVIHHYLGSGTMTHIDLRVCGEQRKGERSKVDTVFIHKKKGGEAALRRKE